MASHWFTIMVIEVDYEKDEKHISHLDQKVFSDRKSCGFDGKINDERLISLFS